MVKHADRSEFIGQIIDIFEDFLEEKGIDISNEEKEDNINSYENPNEIAIIYGSDYGELQTQLEDMMENWNVVEKFDRSDKNDS